MNHLIIPQSAIFTDLEGLVRFATLRSKRRTYDGVVNKRNMQLIKQCRHLYSTTPDVNARIIFTRDTGHHSSGWWKNPDYERCIHLSVSFCVNPTDAPLPFDKRQAQKIADAFFAENAKKCWVEAPYSPEGIRHQVHHYRLFCDEGWQPIIPRGEVYSRELTEAGWKSFSDIHGGAA